MIVVVFASLLNIVPWLHQLTDSQPPSVKDGITLETAQNYSASTISTDPLIVYLDNFLSAPEIAQLLNDRYGSFLQKSFHNVIIFIADVGSAVPLSSSPPKFSPRTLPARNTARLPLAPSQSMASSLLSSPLVRCHSSTPFQQNPRLSLITALNLFS